MIRFFIRKYLLKQQVGSSWVVFPIAQPGLVAYVAAMATTADVPYRHYLREWRKHRGLTQDELAARAEIPKSILSRYETGDRRIHLEVQFKLMAALGIRPAQFFSPPDTPSIDAMVAGETPENRRRLVNLVKAFLSQEDAS
jgi:transcriptional regulator with XRE-family HTH domain